VRVYQFHHIRLDFGLRIAFRRHDLLVYHNDAIFCKPNAKILGETVTEKLLKGLSVFLVGMMGAGKTSVGQVLARQLGYRFFDTDVVIERVKGCSIQEIFVTEGEVAFREIETQVLAQLSGYTQSAIATGGGIVLEPMNWSYLQQGLVVWLDVPVELLAQRLAADETRPLLNHTDPVQKLTTLLEQRRTLYAQADIKITIRADQSPEDAASAIIERIPAILKAKSIPPSRADNS
jgi:shikimate kinase